MAAVAAQYINLAPLLVGGLFFYFIIPLGSCAVSGFLRRNDWGGVARGALCGAVTVVASAMGCSAVVESADVESLNPFIIQSLATAAVGAAVTYWLVGREFWNS